MSLEDYSLMREVIAAIREGLPDAESYAGDWVTRLIRRRGEPAFW